MSERAATIRRGRNGVLYRQSGPEKDVYHPETYIYVYIYIYLHADKQGSVENAAKLCKGELRPPFPLHVEKRVLVTSNPVGIFILGRRSRPAQAECPSPSSLVASIREATRGCGRLLMTSVLDSAHAPIIFKSAWNKMARPGRALVGPSGVHLSFRVRSPSVEHRNSGNTPLLYH